MFYLSYQGSASFRSTLFLRLAWVYAFSGSFTIKKERLYHQIYMTFPLIAPTQVPLE